MFTLLPYGKFRSTTEHLVAEWLTRCSIRWKYEPEGFQIGPVRYRPDFYLPDAEVFLEVKPFKFLHETFKLDELCKNFEKKHGWVVTADSREAEPLAKYCQGRQRLCLFSKRRDWQYCWLCGRPYIGALDFETADDLTYFDFEADICPHCHFGNSIKLYGNEFNPAEHQVLDVYKARKCAASIDKMYDLFLGERVPPWEEQFAAGIHKLLIVARSPADSDFDRHCKEVGKQYLYFKGRYHPTPVR
jgi:hypothetical protein